jgi:hypothetical protein
VLEHAQDILTDLRRNQSPDRDILMMFMSEYCWPFHLQNDFQGYGGSYMEGSYDMDKHDLKQSPPSHCYAKALDPRESMKTHVLSKFLFYTQAHSDTA